MEREEREQEGRENKNGGEAPRLLRLTRRDKELLAHVSVARYLTSEQIQRLIFTGKKATQQSERVAPWGGNAMGHSRRVVLEDVAVIHPAPRPIVRDPAAN